MSWFCNCKERERKYKIEIASQELRNRQRAEEIERIKAKRMLASERMLWECRSRAIDTMIYIALSDQAARLTSYDADDTRLHLIYSQCGYKITIEKE